MRGTFRNTFMDWFGLTAPIVQAPMGGISDVALVAAVGKGGGIGSIAATWTQPDEGLAIAEQLTQAGHPFLFNFVLRFGIDRLGEYRHAGLPAITQSWGFDGASIAAFQSVGTRVGVQVGSTAGARAAIAAGADFIIVQGVEAGGHVQSSTPLAGLLAQVVALAGTVPVIAAGGIATAADIAGAMRVGAQGVMMGTRFVASAESLAHAAYKQAIVEAQAADTAYTNCFDIDWPYAMHRVIRNSTFERWEAAGSPAAPNRPGEGDVVMRIGGHDLVRYCDTPPTTNSEGDLLAACLYAGTSVDGITTVLPASQIVSSLWDEAQLLLS